MTDAVTLDNELFQTTDGEIAVINLDSSRLRSWVRFFKNPLRNAAAAAVVENEQLTSRFVGDLSSLDRLEFLASEVALADGASAGAALIGAQVASAAHRFADARRFLSQAETRGAVADDVQHLLWNIHQACGENLEELLTARRRMVDEYNRFQDLVALGSLLADLRYWDDADRAYRRAIRGYQNVSPFPLAWVYFQLGALWGELVPTPRRSKAAACYQKAIDVLPCYAKARVHLAELQLSDGRLSEAEALLRPIISVGDPEVNWRLADVLAAQGNFDEAEVQMSVARSGFEFLLDRHLLAFADHGAEFYVGSGRDFRRALELVRVNVANRPTLRALERANEIAIAAGDAAAVSELSSTLKACGRHYDLQGIG